MKKLLAVLLAALMILGMCACNKDEGKGNDEFALMTDAVIRNISGENEMIMKMTFEYDDNYKIIGSKIYYEDKLYTDMVCDGDPYRPLSQTDYDEDGNVQYTSTYTYDANGNELTYIRKDAEGNVLSSTANTYSPEGWLTREEYYYEDGDPNWTAYTYDAHGHKISEKNGQGESVWTELTFENTCNGDKLAEVKVYDADGTLTRTETYDADGNQTLQILYSDMGSEYARTEYTYQNGKLVLQMESWGENEYYRTEYTYNDAGDVTEVRNTSVYGEESSESKTVITYENGKLASAKAYENGELEGEYTFNYRNVTVSKEQAEKLAEIYNQMFSAF